MPKYLYKHMFRKLLQYLLLLSFILESHQKGKTMLKFLAKQLTANLLIIISLLSLSSCSKESVIEEPEELEINLNQTDISLEIGKNTRLVAGFIPSDAPNKAHIWTAENTSIATVDETGNVTGVSVGTTRITVTALANKSTATCTVNVVDKVVPVTSITLDSKEETLYVGATLLLKATVLPSNATDSRITWKSSDTTVATVSDNGLVTTLAEGKTVITATAGIKTATCNLTIVPKGIDFSGIRYTNQSDGSLLVTGKINPQGLALSEIGICLSPESTPTVSSKKYVFPLELTVNKSINDLNSNTLYYIRMYAIADGIIYYGKTEAITTAEEIRTIFTCTCLGIKGTNRTRIFNCFLNLEFPRISGLEKLGICFGEAPHPEITDNVKDVEFNNEDIIRFSLSELKINTKYYIRAYSIIGSKITYYPEETAFSTYGSDFNLTITYVGHDDGTITLTVKPQLPEGTYKVSGCSNLSKNKNATNTESNIFIHSGDTFYINHIKYNDEFLLLFDNIETGMQYEFYMSYKQYESLKSLL